MATFDGVQVTSFEDWWEVNSAVYEKAGVTRDIAFGIWSACADAILLALKELQKKKR